MITKSRISIADVAKRASVSKSSVSLVLRAQGERIPLSDESIRRVRDAIRELGYKPNVFAQGLASGRAGLHTLAIVVAHDNALSGHGVSQALAGFTEKAAENGYSCTVVAPRTGPMGALTTHPIFKQRLAEGVAALAWERIEQDSLKELRRQQLPFVAVHMEPGDDDVPCVTSDDVGNAYKATEHLYGLGHRRIAFVGGPLTGDVALQRRAGFTRYLAEHEIIVAERNFLHGENYINVEKSAFLSMITGDDRPTAVVAVSDYVAAALIGWAKEAGLRVPHDLAIVGFDDDLLSGFLDPPLTTIRATAFYQGELAAQMVVDMIAGKVPRRRRLVIPGELIVRPSTLAIG